MLDEVVPLSEEEAELSRKILLGMRQARRIVAPTPKTTAHAVVAASGTDYLAKAIAVLWKRPNVLDSDSTPDILIPLGSGSQDKNVELRLALRSIARNASGWRKIFVVGHDPGWLAEDDRLTFVPCEESGRNHNSRIALKLLWSFQNIPEMSDTAILWNDDHLLIKECDVDCFPFYYNMDLLSEINRLPRESGYMESLRNAMILLDALYRPTLHYDIHAPIALEREKFVALEPFWKASGTSANGVVVKSVYANIWLNYPGVKADDVKLRKTWREKIDGALKWDVISYDDGALQNGLKERMFKMFPVPCSWEGDR